MQYSILFERRRPSSPTPLITRACASACTCQPPPCPSSSSSPAFPATPPFPAQALGATLSPLLQAQSQCLQKFPHLKRVQRKPGPLGTAAPTGSEPKGRSLGTGSSGLHRPPPRVHPGDCRMELLEALGKGRQLKHIPGRPPDTPCVTGCPAPSLAPGERDLLNSCGVGGAGRAWQCALLTHPAR